MTNTILCAAVVGLMVASTQAHAVDMGPKEKCYGLAKAGKNDCKSADGSHSCAGMATMDNGPAEFKMVDAGTCAGQGGSLKPTSGK